MAKRYKQLSLADREKFYALKEQGLSFREIGKRLNRSHQTLSREYKRNKLPQKEYLPCRAEEYSSKRLKIQRTKAPLKNIEIYLYVRSKLRQHWSPETISGRISIDLPGSSIGVETIYQYIYGKGKKYQLWVYLPQSHKKRRIKTGRSVRRDKKSRIPGAVSIESRPARANNRTQIGHVETDLIEGTRGTKGSVSIEHFRKTRYLKLTKMRDKKSETKQKVLQKHLKEIKFLERSNKPIVRSITSDNGLENIKHKKIKEEFKIEWYFCHPYSSWEKGGVENSAGRVRRFIPKGTTISKITEDQIQWVENTLNNTPRKCLGWKTPNEVMESYLNKYKFRKYRNTLECSGALQPRM